MRVLCISYTTKDGDIKVSKIDKDLDELKSLGSKNPVPWVVKCYESKISPNKEKLSYCDWHSLSHNDKNDSSYCLKYAKQYGAPKFGIWDENYNALDTCKHYNEPLLKSFELKKEEALYDVYNFEKWYSVVEQEYKYFKSVLDERNKIKQQIDEENPKKNLKDLNQKLENFNNRLVDNHHKSYQALIISRERINNMLTFGPKSDCDISLYNFTLKNINYRLGLYKEFTTDSEEKILRVYQNSKTIKEPEIKHKEKVKTVENFTNNVVIKADGTIVENVDTGPRMIVGKVIENAMEAAQEKADRIARNTTYL